MQLPYLAERCVESQAQASELQANSQLEPWATLAESSADATSTSSVVATRISSPHLPWAPVAGIS
jgi:hypothetical protein